MFQALSRFLVSIAFRLSTAPPNINNVFPSGTMTAKVGEDITMECYFKAASPTPKTSWKKQGGRLIALFVVIAIDRLMDGQTMTHELPH